VKFDNQLRYALQIIDTYQGEMPLYAWLKSYFRDNKQMGSRDRRLLSTLVYGFYRLGHAVKSLSVEDRILAGLFLCNDQPSEFLQYFRPEYDEKAALPLTEKISFFQTQPAGASFRVTDIFPWRDELSAGIDHEAFCLSFLRQPDLFLRIRPGQEQTVRQKLGSAASKASAASATFIPPFTFRLPNGFNVEEYFTPDQEVVVQDYSSQRIAAFLQIPMVPGQPAASGQTAAPGQTATPGQSTAPDFFWDACAASGGKSILVHDLYPELNITVSDIRDSILRNLRSRFAKAGIKNYQAFLTDLTRNYPPDAAANADLILADVPCTGSGTWSRTPEELWFFNPKKIAQYVEIQKKIIGHIAPRLLPGAWLVYSTCSVFKKENEEMAALIRDTTHGLKQDKMENIKGYDDRADTMFAARFTR
jgi:16S rRNA (cytosine967-C5)-methyltransferase